MSRYFLILGFLLCVSVLFAQPQMAIRERQQPEMATAVIRGEVVYRRACEACHGAHGKGNAEVMSALDPKPQDFSRAVFKFRSTPSGTLPTDGDLFQRISEGIPGTVMPAWKGLLTERERWDVVAYIKTFIDPFKKWEPGPPIAIPDEPEITPERIFAGEQIYKIMECWKCHGQEGRGDGPSAGTLDEWGNRIRPRDFTAGRYKAGSRAQDIYKTVNTGLDGTAMPSFFASFFYALEGLEDLSRYEAYYTPPEIDELRQYVATLPTQMEIETMSETERQALADRRRWALVHFVKSLSRKKSLFYRLFVEDTDIFP